MQAILLMGENCIAWSFRYFYLITHKITVNKLEISNRLRNSQQIKKILSISFDLSKWLVESAEIDSIPGKVLISIGRALWECRVHYRHRNIAQGQSTLLLDRVRDPRMLQDISNTLHPTYLLRPWDWWHSVLLVIELGLFRRIFVQGKFCARSERILKISGF